MKTIATLLLVLTSTVQAQEPTEEQKKAALMEAYRLNGNSMVGWGSIDLSHPHTTILEKDIIQKHDSDGGFFFSQCIGPCRTVKTERIVPSSPIVIDRSLRPPLVACDDRRCKK